MPHNYRYNALPGSFIAIINLRNSGSVPLLLKAPTDPWSTHTSVFTYAKNTSSQDCVGMYTWLIDISLTTMLLHLLGQLRPTLFFFLLTHTFLWHHVICNIAPHIFHLNGGLIGHGNWKHLPGCAGSLKLNRKCLMCKNSFESQYESFCPTSQLLENRGSQSIREKPPRIIVIKTWILPWAKRSRADMSFLNSFPLNSFSFILRTLMPTLVRLKDNKLWK